MKKCTQQMGSDVYRRFVKIHGISEREFRRRNYMNARVCVVSFYHAEIR